VTTLATPLARDLGIEYPIFSVGFGEGATPELVAAVSNAGGCGVLGGCPPDEIRKRIAAVRQLTDRPFGQNVIIANNDYTGVVEEDQHYDRVRVEAAVAENVPLLVLFWGDPSYFVRQAHEAGTRVFIQTGSVDEAVRAANAGVDAVIAQGVEAGGHVRATDSLWDVLPHVVKAVAPLPVIASGAIGDGAGIARALQLGAQGVSLGTRFVACDEAWIHPTYKQKVVESTSADTLLVPDLFDVGWPGAPHRVLRNLLVTEWEAAGRPPSGRRPKQDVPIGIRHRPWGGDDEWPRYASGMIPPDFEGDPDYGPMWAGTSVDVIHDIKPAAAIVRDLVREAEAALA
jgi:nitronate monooxygenase